MRYVRMIGIVFFGLLCFIGGNIWHKHMLLESGTPMLTKALTLQSEPKDLGMLPKGTVLYPYSQGYGTDTYIVFVNTKNRDVLKPASFEHYMSVVPIDGYRN